MAAPATSSLLSTLLQLPLAPFSGKSSPPSVVHVARRAPTAVVAAKGFNVQILVDENEGEESIFRRFRREVMRAGVLQEIKRRRRYESKTDEKKRKAREAGRRNRRRYVLPLMLHRPIVLLLFRMPTCLRKPNCLSVL
jgi:ribosomal protein S21